MNTPLRISTITASTDVGHTLDTRACFERIGNDDFRDIAYAMLFCPTEKRYLVKFDNSPGKQAGMLPFKNNEYKSVSFMTYSQFPLVIYIASSTLSGKASYTKCTLYTTGKLHVVGAKSPEGVESALSVLQRIAGVTGSYATRYHMINAGFKLPHLLIDRVTCHSAWNTHFSDRGHATFNSEHHAAVKIKLTEGGVLLVFRTGNVQVTGATTSMESIEHARDTFMQFVTENKRIIMACGS